MTNLVAGLPDSDTNTNFTYKFERFFDLSPDLLCIAGYDGFFKRINPAVSQLLGYTNEELFSKPINDRVFHEDQHMTAEMRKELTRSVPLLNFENRYVTKSGEIVWLSWTSMPIEDEKLIFAIAKNITHKKKLEEERNSMVLNLSNINRELKQLTYAASHDLRSPVNNLLSLFELLDTAVISDRETLTLINVLRAAGEQLKQNLNSYIDTLIQTEALSVQTEPVDFDESLKQVLRSIDSLVQSSSTTIHADFIALKQVQFNKTYLESIFLNLITNAIKYARPGIAPVISIRSEIRNGISRLLISDNGQGFDMENVKDKIFGLHQKFHSHIDSKGIGLYIVHSHVTALSGRIDLESTLNAGTTFTISFKKE